MNTCAASTDWPSHSDQLIIDSRLPAGLWERLHGFWRTLLNFNPHTVSSEPGQNLAGKACTLLFSPRSNGDASERGQSENEIEDNIEYLSVLDMVEQAAVGDVDVVSGLEGYNNDSPDTVQGYAYLY